MTTTEERRISVGTVTPAFRQVCWPDNSDTTIYFFEAVNPDDIMEMKEFDKVGCLVFWKVCNVERHAILHAKKDVLQALLRGLRKR